MKFIKNTGYLFLRIWFYIMMALPILICFPILLIFISKENWYFLFFKWARLWATITLYGSGFIPIRKNGIFNVPKQSFMFVANHTSMLDIMLMLYTVKNPFVFVGKVELTKIPVFGFFYKKTCIVVDRNSPKSRKEVFEQANRKIRLGYSICIFPEGGVPDESIDLDEFKDGAFRLAIDHQLPIVPLVFPDNKKRFSYTFFSGNLGKTKNYILETVQTVSIELKQKSELKQRVRTLILNTLNKKTEIKKADHE